MRFFVKFILLITIAATVFLTSIIPVEAACGFDLYGNCVGSCDCQEGYGPSCFCSIQYGHLCMDYGCSPNTPTPTPDTMKCGDFPDIECIDCESACTIATYKCGDPIASGCSAGSPDRLAYFCGSKYCGKESCGSSPGCDIGGGACTLSTDGCRSEPASYACGGGTCPEDEKWTASIICPTFTPQHCADSCQPDAECGGVGITGSPPPTPTETVSP